MFCNLLQVMIVRIRSDGGEDEELENGLSREDWAR